jgi:hypothetical protein
MVNFINWDNEDEVNCALEFILRVKKIPQTYYCYYNNLRFWKGLDGLSKSISIKAIDAKTKSQILKTLQPYMAQVAEITKNPSILDTDDFKWDVFMAGVK